MTDDHPSGAPDPALTEPHIAHWVVRSLRAAFAEPCGEQAVDDALRAAGLEPAWLAREGWVSNAFVGRFVAIVVSRLTGSTEPLPWDHPVWQHLREAGRRNFSPELIGPLFPVLRLLGSPERVYRMVPKISRQGNRVSFMDLVGIGPGHCTIRMISTDPSLPDHPAACWNRIGLLEGVPTIWGLPLATVEHRECAHHPHHPAPTCVYHLRFRPRTAALVGEPLLAAMAGGGLLGGLAALRGDPWQIAFAAAGGAGVALAAWALRSAAGSRAAHRRYGDQVAEVLEAADRRYVALWQEQRALQRANLVTRKVAAYLAQDLVERIVEHPELELALGGRRIEAAVLFADIVGFTRRSLGHPPEEVVADLNTWFSVVDPEIVAHGGVIDKRLGDGMMVVFTSRGAEPPEGLRMRALACGLALLRGMPACNERLLSRGQQPLRIRVGLAAGTLVLGNMGSPARLEYTVIGDVVNFAARLQGLAEPDHLLVERASFAGLVEPGQANLPAEHGGDPVTVRSRRVAVRGVGDDVEVLELGAVPAI